MGIHPYWITFIFNGGRSESTTQEVVKMPSSSDASGSEPEASYSESVSSSDSSNNSESEYGYVENNYEVLFVPDENIMQINC